MYQLRADQTVLALLSVTDREGNPARIDGTPSVASSDETVATAQLENNGTEPFTLSITPVGPLGTAQVQVSVDADLGAGVKTVSGVLDVEIVAGEAFALGINPGTPTDLP